MNRKLWFKAVTEQPSAMMNDLHDHGVADQAWLRQVAAHSGRFLFLALGADGPRGLHLCRLLPSKRKCTPNGLSCLVVCEQSVGDSLDLTTLTSVRIHLCCHYPCVVESWHPGKHGALEPPARHGKVLKLLELDEDIDVMAAWETAKHSSSEVLPAVCAGSAATASSTSTPVEHLASPHVAEMSSAKSSALNAASLVPSSSDEVIHDHGDAQECCNLVPDEVVDVVDPMSDVERTAVMLEMRAEQIQIAGTYIGFFELFAFCVVFQRPGSAQPSFQA